MTHGNGDGFWRRWLSHWITGILFSGIFFFGLKWFEPTFLVRALDRAGGDAVIQGYLPTLGNADPRIVVIDLGAAPTARIVASTLESMAGAHTKAIGLDLIVVPDLGDDPSKDGPHPISTLANALQHFTSPEHSSSPIAMPVRNEQLRAAIRTVNEIQPASVELSRDEDGVVRRIILCREDTDGTILPTLAAGMLGLKEPRCDPDDGPPILFAPVGVPRADSKSGVYIVTRETVARQPQILNDSYVLLGTAGRGVGSDLFLTPMGELPGVVIHAQSVWTLITLRGANSWIPWPQHRELVASILDLLIGFAAGAGFSIYTAYTARDDRRADSIASLGQALGCFAEGLFGLLWMAGVLIIIGVAWTSLAVGLLSAGMVIGAMSALFGAMLEVLAHVGNSLVRPVHWAVERSMKHKTVVLVALAIFYFRSPSASSDRADHET
jgi:hypothetical protein